MWVVVVRWMGRGARRLAVARGLDLGLDRGEVRAEVGPLLRCGAERVVGVDVRRGAAGRGDRGIGLRVGRENAADEAGAGRALALQRGGELRDARAASSSSPLRSTPEERFTELCARRFCTPSTMANGSSWKST